MRFMSEFQRPTSFGKLARALSDKTSFDSHMPPSLSHTHTHYRHICDMANKRAAPEEHSPPRKVARAECVQLVIRSLVPTAHASPAEDVSGTSEDQSEADAEPDDGQSIAEVTETYAGSEVESVESVESEDSAAGQSEDEDEGSDDDEESEEDEDADIFSTLP